MMITGNRMTSPNSPTSGESLANSDPQLNGISVIEPVKRSGDNRRVSSWNKSSEVVISESSLVNDREHELIMWTDWLLVIRYQLSVAGIYIIHQNVLLDFGMDGVR